MKTLKTSLLLPVCLVQLCTSDNIFFHGSRKENHRLEHIHRNVIQSVRRQKYLQRLLWSVGETTTTYTAGRCHPNWFLPDGLLPYSSAGNAVLPHHIPHGSDITGGIRHARKKCTWHQKGSFEKKKKSFKTQNCSNSPLKEPEVQSVLTPFSTTNYTPHPSLSIENPQRSSFFRC